MGIPEQYREFADRHKDDAAGFFEMMEKARGAPISDKERQEIWEMGLWRVAAAGARASLPTPSAITRELIRASPERELVASLYDYVCKFLNTSGAYNRCPEKKEALVRGLPRALCAVVTVTILNGEVQNGGFGQFFGNANGNECETIDNLRLIGADRHLPIALEAMRLHQEEKERLEAHSLFRASYCDLSEADRSIVDAIEGAFEPLFDELSSRWWTLEETEPVYDLLTRYVLAHPEECLHSTI